MSDKSYESILIIDETHDTLVKASIGDNEYLDGKLLLTLEYRVDDLDIGQKFQYTMTRQQISDLARFLMSEIE